MICVGIDVAKDKHDCFILNSEGEVLADVFTVPNTSEGFDKLLRAIRSCASPTDKIKVGLEATGHYSFNILGFLFEKGLTTFVINPLHTNLIGFFTIYTIFFLSAACDALLAVPSFAGFRNLQNPLFHA